LTVPISNNLIECFHKQFKAWYKTKQGFSSFDSANNLISMFVFFFNFIRPHSGLNDMTPAQVAGLKLSKKQKREYLLVA
jgi:transposase-like protein